MFFVLSTRFVIENAISLIFNVCFLTAKKASIYFVMIIIANLFLAAVSLSPKFRRS